MDLKRIITEAEELPDDGWNFSLLGARISSIKSGGTIHTRKNTSTVNNAPIMNDAVFNIAAYGIVYIKLIPVMKLLSCKLYMDDPELFLRATKIMHVFIKYYLEDETINPNLLLDRRAFQTGTKSKREWESIIPKTIN